MSASHSTAEELSVEEQGAMLEREAEAGSEEITVDPTVDVAGPDLPEHVERYIKSCHPDAEKARAGTNIYKAMRAQHLANLGIKDGIIRPESITAQLNTRKFYTFNYKPPEGPPIVVVVFIVRRHMRSAPMSEKVLLFIHKFEKVIQDVMDQGAQLHVIVDEAKMGPKNSDIGVIRTFVKLQKVFRDLVTRIYFVNPTPIFYICFKIAKPLLSPRIISKISMQSGAQLKEILPVDVGNTPAYIQQLWDKSVRGNTKAY